MQSCCDCHRSIPPSVSRARCPQCAVRAARAPDGPPCAVCGLADPRVLRMHRLAEGLRSLCANHAAIAGRLQAATVGGRPVSLDALTEVSFPPGDRRRSDRRTIDRRARPRQPVDTQTIARVTKKLAPPAVTTPLASTAVTTPLASPPATTQEPVPEESARALATAGALLEGARGATPGPAPGPTPGWRNW
jgi:hypothetical protein